jgi:hypothetical protein
MIRYKEKKTISKQCRLSVFSFVSYNIKDTYKMKICENVHDMLAAATVFNKSIGS